MTLVNSLIYLHLALQKKAMKRSPGYNRQDAVPVRPNQKIKNMQMKTIVVPTDFSAISNNAIDYAVDLAKVTSCSILLFHAYQVPVSMTDVPIVLLSVEDLQKANESKMDEVEGVFEGKSR